MVRRDITQDADRPHYYSQYWIDIARGGEKSSGSAVAALGTTADAEVNDEADSDDLLMDEVTPRIERSERAEPKKPSRAAEKKPETAGRSTLTSFADLANIANIDMLMKSSAEMGDDVTPDIESATATADDIAPVAGFSTDAAAEESPEAAEADTFDYGDDDEEEDDDWSSSRRKPKQPKPKRRERRDF